MKPKSPVDLGGFQPEFLECLIGEAFTVLDKRLPEPERVLLGNASLLLILLYWTAQGQSLEKLTLQDTPAIVADLTREIWELGGTFANSMTIYSQSS